MREAGAERIKPEHHGTATGYAYGCRCRPCTDAAVAKDREWRHRTGRHKPRKQYLDEVVKTTHGREKMYGQGCRCAQCREAARLARARRRERARQTASTTALAPKDSAGEPATEEE